MEAKKPDPWTNHLQQYGLLDLHQEAERVGYRVRTANDWQFELELVGNLPRYTQPGLRIKAFEMTMQGKAQARLFLREVHQSIDDMKS